MSYLCQKCESEISEGALFCSKCGEKVAALRCPNCGKRLPEDSAFCSYCGAKVAVEQEVPQLQQITSQGAEVTLNAANPPVVQQAQKHVQPQQLTTTEPNTSRKKMQPADASPHPSIEKASDMQPSDSNADSEQDAAPAPGNEAYQGTDVKEYHLTRRKYTGYVPSTEKTDVVISEDEISITDHNVNFLGGSKPEANRSVKIADLRAITVGSEVSAFWLCLSLFITLGDLLIILYQSSSFKITFIILTIVSWLMVWRQRLTFHCKDGTKISIRGKEKAVMQDIRQNLLNCIETKPDYTGDLSDVVVKRTQYYLPEFEKAKRNEKCRFNWCAFFFNGIFAYYRKSQEVFWHYYKWPLIIYAVIILGVSGSSFLAVKSGTGLVGWFIAVGVLSLAINIYLLITNIRFGKNFNREYYQHCVVRAESSEVTPRAAGTSVKNAILYWLVVSLCVVLIGGIAGGLVGAAFLGGTSDDLWDVGENYDTAEDNSGYYIWDKAGILAEEDHIALILQISDVVEARNCGVYIITISNTSNSGYSDTLNAAEEMYSELNLGVGANHNGVLLLMSTEDRHFSVVAYGDYVESIFNNKGLESLQNISVPYFRNDDWYGGLSAYVSAVSELLDGVGLSAGTPVTISDFVGDYTYDASFTNPDGTEANYCYMLSIEPSNNGVTISEMWRGMYIFCDDWASQNDLEGDTLYFVVKYGDNAGTHSLTYIPATQSPYGADTIYIDGDTDMPYTRDSYQYAETEASIQGYSDIYQLYEQFQRDITSGNYTEGVQGYPYDGEEVRFYLGCDGMSAAELTLHDFGAYGEVAFYALDQDELQYNVTMVGCYGFSGYTVDYFQFIDYNGIHDLFIFRSGSNEWLVTWNSHYEDGAIYTYPVG